MTGNWKLFHSIETVFEEMEFTEIIKILRLYNGDVLTLSAPSLKNSSNFSIKAIF